MWKQAHWMAWRVGEISSVGYNVVQDNESVPSCALCRMTHPSELLSYSEAFLLWLTTASLLACVAICGPFLLLLPQSPLPDFLEPSPFFSPTLPGKLASEISISSLPDPLWVLVSGSVDDFEVLPEVVSVPAAPPLPWVSGEPSIKNTKVQCELWWIYQQQCTDL